MLVVLAGLLLLLCAGCARDEREAEHFSVYHLEAAVGPPGEEGELSCGPPTAACPGIVEQPPPRTFRYAVLAAPALTTEHIDRSTVRQENDPATGQAVVLVDLTARGSAAFAAVTKTAARIGGRDQAWNHLAVVVGDEIVSFPEVDYDAYPDGIAEAPGIQIAAASATEARELVARLQGEAAG